MAEKGLIAQGPRAMTEPQMAYIRSLQRRLRLPETLLDNECVKRFGRHFAALDVRQASDLIETLAAWESLPAEMERARGQLDLF